MKKPSKETVERAARAVAISCGCDCQSGEAADQSWSACLHCREEAMAAIMAAMEQGRSCQHGDCPASSDQHAYGLIRLED